MSWNIINKYFKNEQHALVLHHIQSYNEFINKGIQQIFQERNPIKIRKNYNENLDDYEIQVNIYFGKKDGNSLHFGKPMIYDKNRPHFMIPNEARLRNMNYSFSLYVDILFEFISYNQQTKEFQNELFTIDKHFFGKFPIMLHSDLCVLSKLNSETRFNMGECKNDYGGYFIVDGKEKAIVCQEKFADNMLYIKKNAESDIYEYTCAIRMVSEDASKPERTMKIYYVSPSDKLTNKNILVDLPNVRKPIPLFILMRALGVISDKSIISCCLLDLEVNSKYIDLFIPSVHDAGVVFSQDHALKYIGKLTKRQTIVSAHDILMNYLLPNIGTTNYLHKAYFIGYMVFELLKVKMGDKSPTDRDSFMYKRVEVTGKLLYDLFKEYYKLQEHSIFVNIDKRIFYKTRPDKETDYVNIDFVTFNTFIKNYETQIFGNRIVETGFRKGFKGNWGSTSHTKKDGIVQDLNRLSYNSALSHLRKLNLPLDASAKVVGPRLLHPSQYGFIDPIDTPDGSNIGLHKHLSIITYISNKIPLKDFIEWMYKHVNMKSLEVFSNKQIFTWIKVFVNGMWVGVIDEPFKTVELIKKNRRYGLIPKDLSISFYNEEKKIEIFIDSGRLMRPIYYLENNNFSSEEIKRKILDDKFDFVDLYSSFEKKKLDLDFKNYSLFSIDDLYDKKIELLKYKEGPIEYIDTNETETALIALEFDELKESPKNFTHVEIDPSLILGIMGNQIIFPENNPPTRNAFSCGQTRQAVSLYHSNYQSRMDKTGIVLNYGQVPLIKSKYLNIIQKEEHPHGENAIVAIMSYTGYNVEDAILINKGSVDRGIFRTSYYSVIEAKEESTSVKGSTEDTRIMNINNANVFKKKPGYDYSYLDDNGLIKKGTYVNDEMIMIGKATKDPDYEDVFIDNSLVSKKGQLGYVDKTYMTEDEEGFRIAKIKICDQRIPTIGDKMASRAGQKGTIGIIIPEEDMPYSKDGIKPDLIINPHAIPSRMTIGQLVESVFGKICLHYGSSGNCTAFENKGSKHVLLGEMLNEIGYHSSGNEILYNGMTGEQIETEIFMGPNYYMRLKHMVKDKINYRAKGPITLLTRQTVQGRANDGGLRIGEMERDGLIAHGSSKFIQESFMIRGDEYAMAICNTSGCVAVYNIRENNFYSLHSDGNIEFANDINDSMKIKSVSRFGRNFSIVNIPYSFKLLIQELQTMNIQIRLITEDNVDNFKSMNFYKKDLNLNQIDKNMDSTPGTPSIEPTTPSDSLPELGEADIEFEKDTDDSDEDYGHLIRKKDPETGGILVEPRYGKQYGDIGYYFMNMTLEQRKKVLKLSFDQQVVLLKSVSKQLSSVEPKDISKNLKNIDVDALVFKTFGFRLPLTPKTPSDVPPSQVIPRTPSGTPPSSTPPSSTDSLSSPLKFNPDTPESKQVDYGLSSSENARVSKVFESIDINKEENSEEFPSVTMKVETEPKDKATKIDTIENLIKDTNQESIIEQKDEVEDSKEDEDDSNTSEKKSVKIDT